MAGPGSFVGTRASGFGGWWRAGRARSTARRGGAGGGHGGRGGVAVPAGTGPDGGVGGRCELQRGRAVPARAKARPVPRGHCSRRAAATGGHGERRANVRRALAGRRRRQAQPARALAASARERGDGGGERGSGEQQRETHGACSALAVPHAHSRCRGQIGHDGHVQAKISSVIYRGKISGRYTRSPRSRSPWGQSPRGRAPPPLLGLPS